MPKDTESKWLFPPGDLAEILGVNISTIHRRAAMPDFPKNCRKSRGLYDIRDFIQFCFERFADGDIGREIQQARLRKLNSSADREEMARDKEAEKLITKENIIKDLSYVITATRQRLLSWYKTLPPYLIGRDEKEMGVQLRVETRKLLEDMSKGIDHIKPKTEGKAKKRNKRQ